jgi:hypothetical protein
MTKKRSRFAIAAAMLRKSGLIGGYYGEKRLPGQREKESPVDWLVRIGLAQTPAVAAEMLILGAGLTALLNELENMEKEHEQS